MRFQLWNIHRDIDFKLIGLNTTLIINLQKVLLKQMWIKTVYRIYLNRGQFNYHSDHVFESLPWGWEERRDDPVRDGWSTQRAELHGYHQLAWKGTDGGKIKYGVVHMWSNILEPYM